MMHHHRCSGSCHGAMVGGPCSCGPLFYGHQNNSFPMLFSMPNQSSSYVDEADHMYSFDSSSPSSSSVDCTLSLGTPSTRLSSNEKSNRRSSNSCMSNFCWDILQSKHSSSSSHHKSSRSGGSSNNNSGGETLLSRRCANCDTTSTPLWRNGPKGPKSLCNACGIRFKKEERRASAAAAAAAASNGVPAGAGVDGQHMLNSSWVHHHHHSSYDDRDDSDTSGIPYLSWRLNVTDRPAGLIHEFTR